MEVIGKFWNFEHIIFFMRSQRKLNITRALSFLFQEGVLSTQFASVKRAYFFSSQNVIGQCNKCMKFYT